MHNAMKQIGNLPVESIDKMPTCMELEELCSSVPTATDDKALEQIQKTFEESSESFRWYRFSWSSDHKLI